MLDKLMSQDFVISQSDERPMYLQIMEQIKQRIAVGDWTQGEAIPSIRRLASDLQVSVITVKRAYLELKREGVIVTHKNGSYVASIPELGARPQAELKAHLEKLVGLAILIGIRPKELEGWTREAVIASRKRNKYERSRARTQRRG
jgi:GntR family transcriptional regulator